LVWTWKKTLEFEMRKQGLSLSVLLVAVEQKRNEVECQIGEE
jgi:hypothetical protein